MNIIYVQSSPLYHEVPDHEQFLELANRDKWMPSLTVQKGYPSELWIAGEQSLETQWQYDTLPQLPIRIFKTDRMDGKSRDHTSEELNRAALVSGADLFVLKGMDGGIGVNLAKKVLIPNNIPYAIIIGGEWYHPIVKHAKAVCYETEWQRRKLTTRSIRFWRSVVDDSRLIHLPKSVDTRHFAPDPEVKKEFDVIGMGRLIPHYKNYDALFEASKHMRVGFIGGGPMFNEFRKKYPGITWFGPVDYAGIPSHLNKGRVFFHTGLRDHHPRSITEAAACGVPPVAFANVIHEDVIPDHIGLRVSPKQYIGEIEALLGQTERLQRMAREARNYAETYRHHLSSRDAIRRLIAKLHDGQSV